VTSPTIVLALDRSLAIAMQQLWEVALASAASTAALLRGQGNVTLMGYAETASVLDDERLADLSWDFVYGSNLHGALKLVRELLGPADSPKRAIFVAEAQPTAHCLPNGEVFFMFPPVSETAEATLEEARSCSRDDIRVDFLLLRPDAPLRDVADRIAAICHGLVSVHRADQPISITTEEFVRSIGLA
jgi:uncharacterized protein with von Willebrand factor type A (vWA) domain